MAYYSSLEETGDPTKDVETLPSGPLDNKHLHVPGSHDQGRRLSLPFSEQRRKQSYGFYNRTVAVAVDPSEHSRDAFNWYLAHVWRAEDLIVIVYCPEPPNIPSFSLKKGFALPTEKWAEIVMETNAKAQQLEIQYESMCVSKKLRYKIRGESYKNAGEGVCRIAEEEKADLIVMGTRGIGPVKRVLIGSVSEYIVRNSNIPCLVVPVLK